MRGTRGSQSGGGVRGRHGRASGGAASTRERRGEARGSRARLVGVALHRDAEGAPEAEVSDFEGVGGLVDEQVLRLQVSAGRGRA